MTFDLIVCGHLTHDTIITSDKRAHETLGGAAAYTSLAAAKLGAIVGIATKVGTDFRDAYLEYLRRANVDLLGLKVKMGKTTAFENAYDERGKRTQRLLSYNQPIEAEDIPAAYINARCFHFGPVFHEVSYDIIKFAHEKGILTSLDPQGYCRERGPRYVVKLRGWKEAKETLPYVDILKCDETEAKKLTKTGDLNKAARVIQGFGPKIVLVTRGAKGLVLCHEDEVEKIPVIPAEKLVDPTGAGDVYSAGFIVEYLRTKDQKYSALFASCVASFVVEGIGTTTLPTREMVMRRLGKYMTSLT
ncbi:MAG: putative sugar kinase [Candidatus Bathyarchaeota archaeon BA1]|nr:MAG: putative sugar kinase [Candidatus Bathyarchaeota archaeon BA1]